MVNGEVNMFSEKHKILKDQKFNRISIYIKL